MTEHVDRESVLNELDRARLEFEESLRRAPDAALRYKPAGEDYALGGLVVHVADVMRRYAHVADELRAANFEAFLAPDWSTPAEDAALIREGFVGDKRPAVLEDMRSAHSAFVDAIRNTPESTFRKQAPVTYGSSSQAYPTAPADIVGWVLDHYREHTLQIGDLVTAWADASR
jgi:hypothetical protein